MTGACDRGALISVITDIRTKDSETESVLVRSIGSKTNLARSRESSPVPVRGRSRCALCICVGGRGAGHGGRWGWPQRVPKIDRAMARARPFALTSLHAGVVSDTDLDPRFTVSHK